MPFNALTESLSFHKSPESFISSRLAEIASEDPAQLPSTNSSTGIVRASILNRNVHVISDYELCRQVLSSGDAQASSQDDSQRCPFRAGPAYNELMAPFFPPPNLLLADGSSHVQWKERWQRHLAEVPERLATLFNSNISTFINARFRHDTIIDIYESIKDLAWQLLLATFVAAPSYHDHQVKKMFEEIESLQETLLRGQFSTFPISIKVPFWSSARNRGINSRAKIQEILKKHYSSLQSSGGKLCPLLLGNEITDIDDISNHALMFTSGLANKALASLLTSTIMNIFVYHPSNSSSTPATSLAQLLRSMPSDSPERSRMLRSILLETERLSPPVVGVLRRANEDFHIMSAFDPGMTHIVSQRHEAWLYFPSASRSHSIFGEDAELFRWDRFMHLSPDEDSSHASFSFGAGPKTCLGRDISRKIVELVISALLDSDIEIEPVPGSAPQPGVQAMLGWCTIEDAGGVQAIARDLKQLPTQRARKPVLGRILKIS